jgi:HEAT repeat protein
MILLTVSLRADEPGPRSKEEPSYGSKTLSQWMAELKDASPVIRREAAVSLGHLDPPTKSVIPTLLAVLKDPDAGVQSCAAGSLVHLDRRRIDEALPALLAGAKSQDRDVRRGAIEALGEAGPSAACALPQLTVALRDPDRSVRKAAAISITEVDPSRAGVAVPVLMEVLKEGPDCIGPPEAAQALLRIGTSAKETVPALIAGLKDPALQKYSAYTLGLIGPGAKTAIPALVEARSHTDLEFRFAAAMALVEIDATQAKAGVAVLAKELTNPEYQIRKYAVRALGEIGQRAAEAVPALLRALVTSQKDRQNEEDAIIAETLGEIGTGAKEAVPSLVAMIKTDNPLNRFAPIMALGWMGAAAKGAVPALKSVVENEDKGEGFDRWCAAQALVRIDPASADPALHVLNASAKYWGGHDWLLLEGLELFEALGPSAKGAAPALLTALKESEPAFHVRLIEVLCGIDPASAVRQVPSLIRDLKSSNPEVRSVAIKALGVIGPPANAAVRELRAVLKSDDYWLEAAISLTAIGGVQDEVVAMLVAKLKTADTAQRPNQATPLLEVFENRYQRDRIMMSRWAEECLGEISRNFPEEMFDRRPDPDAVLRSYVIRTLGQLGEPARTAVPALLKARHDPDAGVRLSAACALVRIAPQQSKDVVPDLTMGLQAAEWWVRAGAARALGDIGGNAKLAVPRLAICLDDPIKPVRKGAAAALKKIDPDAAQRLFAR